MLVQRLTLNTTLFTTLFATLVTTLFTTLVRSATAWACLTTPRQPAGGPAHELTSSDGQLTSSHGQLMANEREELINPVRDRKDELAISRY
jgi:hypothetical protein